MKNFVCQLRVLNVILNIMGKTDVRSAFPKEYSQGRIEDRLKEGLNERT